MNRYFLALPIPIEIKSKITDFISTHDNLDVVWEIEQNWHLTLIPTKELDDAKFQSWVDKCSKYLAEGIFTVNFKSVSIGPTKEDPRLIWVTADQSLPLSELKTGLEQELGYTPDHPNFIPHITLARLAHHHELGQELKHFTEPVHWSMKVNRFAIFQSQQIDNKHLYTIIREFPI